MNSQEARQRRTTATPALDGGTATGYGDSSTCCSENNNYKISSNSNGRLLCNNDNEKEDVIVKGHHLPRVASQSPSSRSPATSTDARGRRRRQQARSSVNVGRSPFHPNRSNSRTNDNDWKRQLQATLLLVFGRQPSFLIKNYQKRMVRRRHPIFVFSAFFVVIVLGWKEFSGKQQLNTTRQSVSLGKHLNINQLLVAYQRASSRRPKSDFDIPTILIRPSTSKTNQQQQSLLTQQSNSFYDQVLSKDKDFIIKNGRNLLVHNAADGDSSREHSSSILEEAIWASPGRRLNHVVSKTQEAKKSKKDQNHKKMSSTLTKADYGGLNLHTSQDSGMTYDMGLPRHVHFHYHEGESFVVQHGTKNKKEKKKSAHVSSYLAFDDDIKRGSRVYNGHHDGVCQRPSWYRDYYPNCNFFHEIDFVKDGADRLGNGYFKVAYKYELPFTMPDRVVVKYLRTKHSDFDPETYEASRMEGLILERLSSSPRIVNIYGACATSVSIEYMPLEVQDHIIRGSGYASAADIEKCEKKYGTDGGMGLCDKGMEFNATQKLEMAAGMARALADVHGFVGGVIVHDDIQPCQFLRNEYGEMKLNDFNRGEVMLYDDEHGTYCRYKNGGVYGNARAPEEDAEGKLNEQIDVYSLGNIFYELLTGLWNFYEYEDDSIVQQKVMDGEMPYIDERYAKRSYAEEALVHAIERSLVFDPKERATVFELADFLTNAVNQNKKQEQSLMTQKQTSKVTDRHHQIHDDDHHQAHDGHHHQAHDGHHHQAHDGHHHTTTTTTKYQKKERRNIT